MFSIGSATYIKIAYNKNLWVPSLPHHLNKNTFILFTAFASGIPFILHLTGHLFLTTIIKPWQL